MRIYSGSSEETLRARELLIQWTSEGSLSKEQYERLACETVSGLRTTNIFLRVVLFLFTLICVAAAVGFFFSAFLSRPSEPIIGMFLLIFCAGCYTGAEVAVTSGRLYRYGIEEALAVCSVALLYFALTYCSGIGPGSREYQWVIPAAAAAASLWTWYRFNLWYAWAAAMILAISVPGDLVQSHAGQRLLLSMAYAAGLGCISLIRAGHRSDYLESTYSLSEALLWLGLYLVFNLKISDMSWPWGWWSMMRAGLECPAPFYWTTWVLVWCLPPLMLVRGVWQRDRLILAVGTMTAVLTLVTNKPYLGWQRHTWEPMLLGIALAGVAVFVRRWLGCGRGGVRYGFTAAHLSGKDRSWMEVGAGVLGLMTPQAIMAASQPADAEFRFGGGGSGGGGASGEF